ncbi:hypothetical protein [Acidiphilium acidophilum]|uniref:COG4705 family protein n=1 Tax=Acidiphilium acidophilum TaxID=76588 RepID=UPI002E8E76B2|nr:hypothetical protein [Acidiphilium acidophilum]
MSSTAAALRPVYRRPMLTKVPEITLMFWVIKILSTAMGEATSDFLVFHVNPYLAVISGFLGFAGALVLQLAVRRYIAPVYWLVVVMISIFGTMIADVIHIVLGVPYALTTLGFGGTLAIVLILWHLVESSLSIHTICTTRRELFYWATVVATFALGTAAGDFTASSLGLGYEMSAVLFIIVFLIPVVGYRWFGWNEIFAFWFAYIATRPMGASFADWTDKPRAIGGLGYGTPAVSLILTVVIVILVAAATRRPDGSGRQRSFTASERD